MSRIHRIHLTRPWVRPMRDPQLAHSTIEASAHNDPDSPRTLWALPHPDLLLVRAEQLDLPPGMATDVHAAPYDPRPAEGDQITLTTIVNPRIAGYRCRTCGRTYTEQSRLHNPGDPLCACPRDGSQRRTVYRAATTDETLPWLQQHLDGALAVSEHQVQNLGPAYTASRRRDPHPIVRHAISITGTVTHADRLRRLVRDGVGHAKAFGCGLLLIQEAR